ncbi:MAG: hypothetical protein K5694_00610 [Bacilli bacterium]|nr:hypothetical protein [Bacilli bacterium]
MKKHNIYNILAIAIAGLCVCSCGQTSPIVSQESKTSESSTISEERTSEETSSESIDPGSGWQPGEGTYTITFISEGEVVAIYENLPFGAYVDIPEVTHSSDRYYLEGWDGIDEEDFLAGRVMVYENDSIYTAKWVEKFGTDTVFEAMERKFDNEIAIDGYKDEAYGQASSIPISVVTSGESDTKADAYVMWDESFLYLLIEVEDSTYTPYVSGAANDFDSVNVYMDLLHDDCLAVDGYTTGWGQPYRGEPGPMCEGMFRIAAGVSYPQGESRYGAGSEFDFIGWLSNAAKESGSTVGTTIETDAGYNVEYRIDCTNVKVPTDLHLHEDQQIGIGINIIDKNGEDKNVVCLEEVNKDMADSPKKLSNFVLAGNPLQNRHIYSATHVRESYKVTTKQKCDAQFNDALETLIGDSTAKIIWDEDGLYFYFAFGEGTSSIELRSPLLDSPVILSESGKVMVNTPISDNSILPEFDIVINGDEENIIKSAIRLKENTNNVTPSRKLVEADYLDGEDTITVDGVMDNAYLDAPEIDISTNSLVEKSDLAATGKARIKWDDEYIYIFVDVTDSDVDGETVNNQSPEKNDSVEIWISTCQTMPTLSTRWGWPVGGVNSLRPREDYCGEGKFARRAGNPDNPTVGTHWMWDNIGLVKRETASVLTETGYTTEFKIGWGTFASEVEDKVNEIIDLGININDGENNSRKGVVCMNADSHNIHTNPGYMDHLLLGKN